MSNAKAGAYGGASTTTGKERKTWDRDAYADQAKSKDSEAATRARERAEALKKGEHAYASLYLGLLVSPSMCWCILIFGYPRYMVLSTLSLGKRLPRRREELPKATQLLQAREAPLELEKNLNKTLIVSSGRPGFSCQLCRRTFKDSSSYLGHVNGRYRESSCLVTIGLCAIDKCTSIPYTHMLEGCDITDRCQCVLAYKH